MKGYAAWLLLLTLYGIVQPAEPWTVDRIVGLNYPRRALAEGLQGTVQLRCKIAKDGKVSHVDRLSGSAELASAAIENLMAWRFRRVSSGEGSYMVVYHFRIQSVRAMSETPRFRFIMPGDVFITGEKVTPKGK